MNTCELCGKQTPNVAEKRIGMDYNPTTDKETPIPYTMPLYCNDCFEDIEALDADASDLEAIRLQWQAYRSEGLGTNY